jgi:hypothetical protein
MGSGLFDEYPKLKVILGHLGEGLPFGIWRVDHRISRTSVRPKAKLPIAHYLRENFYITTSGAFRTQALTDVIMEVGADRVLYSVDYPYEDMVRRLSGSTTLPSANLIGSKLPTATRGNCSAFNHQQWPGKDSCWNRKIHSGRVVGDRGRDSRHRLPPARTRTSAD